MCLFRIVNPRTDQNSNVCVLVWLHKPKYGAKAKLCYMDTDNFIVCIKTDDIYKDIVKDVETRFDASNYELGRPLRKGKNKVIGLMEDELGGKIMKKLVATRAKTYSYLIDNSSKDK